MSQKIYMSSEDLTIAIAGFRTGHLRSFVYNLLCVLSLGTAYLLLRWLPKWRIRLLGIPTPLCECNWVVVEVSYILLRRGEKEENREYEMRGGPAHTLTLF